MNKSSIPNDTFESVLARIGEVLYDLRVKKGYSSHADFASDFNLPRIQYWRMERGKSNVTLKSLHKVLSIHGLTVGELFSLTSDYHSRIKRQCSQLTIENN